MQKIPQKFANFDYLSYLCTRFRRKDTIFFLFMQA